MRIDEPGLVPDLANTDYHAQTQWLSSSMLKGLLPEHYKAPTSRDALDFGSAFHTRALGEGDAVRVIDAVTVKGEPSSSWTKQAEEERTAADAAGEIPILRADSERVDAMVESLHAHDVASELLYHREGTAELSAFTDVDGLPCRARFDRLISGAVVDLKSTSSKPGRQAITRAVVDYGYDTSAAHYLAVAQALGLDVEALALVFVGKTPPHHVTVCDLDEAFLARGRALRRLAIERHLDPTAPAYEGATGFVTLDCPRWAAIADPEPIYTYQESA